jgi:hypothetical protein
MQITQLLEVLHERCTAHLEASPTDLRRTSATDGLSAQQLLGVRQRKDECPALFYRENAIAFPVVWLIYND